MQTFTHTYVYIYLQFIVIINGMNGPGETGTWYYFSVVSQTKQKYKEGAGEPLTWNSFMCAVAPTEKNKYPQRVIHNNTNK